MRLVRCTLACVLLSLAMICGPTQRMSSGKLRVGKVREAAYVQTAAIEEAAGQPKPVSILRGYGRFCFSPDGGAIALALTDQTFAIVDALTGQVRRSFDYEGKQVWNFAYSDDGHSLFASGLYDESVGAWDAASGKREWFLGGRSRGGRDPEFDRISYLSPHGRYLATARDGKISWTLTPGTAHVEIRRLPENKLAAKVSIRSQATGPLVSFSKDEQQVLLVSELGSVVLIDVVTGKAHDLTSVSTHPSRTVFAAADGAAFLPIKGYPGIKSFSLFDGSTDRSIRTSQAVDSVVADAAKRYLAVGNSHRVEVIDLSTSKIVCALNLDSSQGQRTLAFSPDGELLAVEIHGAVAVYRVTSLVLERSRTSGCSGAGATDVCSSSSGFAPAR